jgi:DNA/RNA endonuclease YhcR with UshA esterase domain
LRRIFCHPHLPPANIATTTPATISPASTGVLAAENIQALQSHIGDLVTVQGNVRNVRLVTAGSAANVFFDGTGATPAMVWVPWGTFPKLQAVLGKDLAAALDGRVIKAAGRLSIYKGSIELTLDDPSRLIVVPSAVQARGTKETGQEP